MALVVGVVGVWAMYLGHGPHISLLGRTGRQRSVRPFVFVGPAIVVLTFYPGLPGGQHHDHVRFQDTNGEDFVGFDNYVTIFTESQYLTGIRNSILWVLFVPFVAVAIGLGFATLADKLSRRAETIAKSLIFLPMAISFVGASVVWTFVYASGPKASASRSACSTASGGAWRRSGQLAAPAAVEQPAS